MSVSIDKNKRKIGPFFKTLPKDFFLLFDEKGLGSKRACCCWCRLQIDLNVLTFSFFDNRAGRRR